MNNLPEPLNANERFLHAIVLRQEIVIEQLSSIVEHIAKKDVVAVEEVKVVDEVKVADEVKPAPRRRTSKANKG